MGKRTLFIAAAIGCVELLAFTFYNSLLAGIFLAPAGIYIFRKMCRKEKQKRRLYIMEQCKEWLASMSASMAAGYSLENAILASREEMERIYTKSSFIYRKVEEMRKKLRVQIPLADILERFARETGIDEMESFAKMVVTARQAGGDIRGIMDNIARQLRGKLDVEREISVLISGKAYEQKIMMCIPVFIILFIRLTSWDTISVLYGNLLGILVMTICMGIYIVAILWGEKITEIEA